MPLHSAMSLVACACKLGALAPCSIILICWNCCASCAYATPPQAASGASSASSSRTAGAAATAAPPTTASDDGLKIAWQYRKYIQNQQRAEGSVQQPTRSKTTSTSSSAAAAAALAAGVGREWCHQFDLTKPLSQEALHAAKLQVTCCCSQQQQGAAAVQAAAAAAVDFLAKFQPKGPIPGGWGTAQLTGPCVSAGSLRLHDRWQHTPQR